MDSNERIYVSYTELHPQSTGIPVECNSDNEQNVYLSNEDIHIYDRLRIPKVKLKEDDSNRNGKCNQEFSDDEYSIIDTPCDEDVVIRKTYEFIKQSNFNQMENTGYNKVNNKVMYALWINWNRFIETWLVDRHSIDCVRQTKQNLLKQVHKLKTQIHDELKDAKLNNFQVFQQCLIEVERLEQGEEARHIDAIVQNAKLTNDENCINIAYQIANMVQLQSNRSNTSVEESMVPDDSIQLTEVEPENEQIEIKNLEDLQHKFGNPRTSSIEEIAIEIADRESICVLVGQTSGPSLYKLKLDTYKTKPLIFWQMLQAAKQSIDFGRPKAMHCALAKIVSGFQKIGKSASVITSEQDGYQRQILSRDSTLFEINGNIHFNRCQKSCSKDLYKMGTTTSPTCTQCGNFCRPHMMLSDEPRDPKLYRLQAAQNAIEYADCVLVIGQQCIFNQHVVVQAAKRHKLIVELTESDPISRFGNVMVLEGNPEVEILELEGWLGDLLYNN